MQEELTNELIGLVIVVRLLDACIDIFTLGVTFGTAVAPCRSPSGCAWVPVLTSKVIIVPVRNQYEKERKMRRLTRLASNY
jgi:hypothetical protein